MSWSPLSSSNNGSSNIDISYGSDGSTPLAYTCTELFQHNTAASIEITYYYDLLRDKNVAKSTVLAQSKADLINSIASEYGLLDGGRCSLPPINQLWVIKVDSPELEDTHINDFGK